MAATQNGYKHDQDAKALVNGYHEKDQDTSTSDPDSPPTKDTSGPGSLLSALFDSINRILPPSSRTRIRNSISHFTSTRPVVSSFIAAQLLFSTIPILVFIAFTLTALVASLTTVFIAALFSAGVALLFLVPTLLLTSSLAVLAWVWVAGAFLAGRWVYLRAYEVGGLNALGRESGTAETKKEE